MAVEHASDPGHTWRGINAALRLWLDMPAEVWKRMEQAGARSQRAAVQRLEAQRVRSALQAQGRRNAEELRGDSYYVERDY
ncbi:hypothetical protein M434DRAFT_34769 [Hypoxylon sp. CO27-5]|nr:hypothetical protein M434DRAFT_34769 [Hypoxylon sp. CO27-5]